MLPSGFLHLSAEPFSLSFMIPKLYHGKKQPITHTRPLSYSFRYVVLRSIFCMSGDCELCVVAFAPSQFAGSEVQDSACRVNRTTS